MLQAAPRFPRRSSHRTAEVLEPVDLFVSYSHHDPDAVAIITDHLERLGHKVFVDDLGTAAGDEFVRVQGAAIDDSDTVLVVAGVADVGDSVVGAAGDPPGPSTPPAGPLRSVGAPRAVRAVLCVAPGDRFDHTTSGAGHRELPSPAPRADPAGR